MLKSVFMKKNENIQALILLHIQENLMDLSDDGKLVGEDLQSLQDSMGEIASAIIECLGLEIEEMSEDGFIKAKLKLTDLID